MKGTIVIDILALIANVENIPLNCNNNFNIFFCNKSKYVSRRKQN